MRVNLESFRSFDTNFISKLFPICLLFYTAYNLPLSCHISGLDYRLSYGYKERLFHILDLVSDFPRWFKLLLAKWEKSWIYTF